MEKNQNIPGAMYFISEFAFFFKLANIYSRAKQQNSSFKL